MKLYNSYSQTIEELKPIEPGKISMYVCGPTVYNYPHIGNARPIVVFDTLKKALSAQGYEVTFASNYTDVDDKIIKTAIEQNVTEKEITDKFIVAYNDVRKGLHADLPDYAPRVTETMDRIIEFIDKMVKNGSAYQVGGDVYFRVNSDKKYGELSHQSIDDLMVGARIDENEKKENPLDFTLWKETTEGIKWDSPWSKGRPGWHTECVVMIQDVFKKTLIDIHGIKMSKSLGNVWWAKDLIANHGGNLTRWLMISTHYRAPLNLNEEAFSTSKKELDKIAAAYKQACVKLALSNAKETTAFDETYTSFIDALNDDLNTPNAISVVYEVVKKINQAVRQREIDVENLAVLVHTLEKMLYILGIEFDKITMSEEDKEMYQNWRSAVKEKDFETADTLRAALIEKGIL